MPPIQTARLPGSVTHGRCPDLLYAIPQIDLHATILTPFTAVCVLLPVSIYVSLYARAPGNAVLCISASPSPLMAGETANRRRILFSMGMLYVHALALRNGHDWHGDSWRGLLLACSCTSGWLFCLPHCTAFHCYLLWHFSPPNAVVAFSYLPALRWRQFSWR